MKHLAKIQKEFVKEARDWNNLSFSQQQEYLWNHPATKKRITAKPKQQLLPEFQKQYDDELSDEDTKNDDEFDEEDDEPDEGDESDDEDAEDGKEGKNKKKKK